jgi:hypothetical protein
LIGRIESLTREKQAEPGRLSGYPGRYDRPEVGKTNNKVSLYIFIIVG